MLTCNAANPGLVGEFAALRPTYRKNDVLRAPSADI